MIELKHVDEWDIDEMPRNLLNRLQCCRTLPSVPVVVMQVLDLAGDMDNIGTADLAHVISRDPAMVTKILKVANSVRYGISREVATLDQAVMLLGLTGTMSLTLSFSLATGLKTKNGGTGFDHLQYWRRAVISAVASTETGSLLNDGNRGELFLAGLIHDIGMLALNETLPEYGRLTASSLNDHYRLIEIERRELQADHAIVGAWLLKKWGLPKRLVSAVYNSHIDKKSTNPLANFAALASRVADIWINTESVQALENTVSVADSLFSMGREQIDSLLAGTAKVFPEMVADLDINIGDDFEINKLLDQSRNTLAEINIQMIHESRRLVAQAQRDSLTTLYNRYYLEQNLDNMVELSVNTRQPLTAIFVDVDLFEVIHDTYGHTGSDIVLVEIAKIIQSAIRNYDVAVRYDGDKFVVLLANAPQDVARSVSERISSVVADKVFVISQGVEIRLTVSVGHATLTPSTGIKTSAELLEAADKKLHTAKYTGRGYVS